MHLERAEITRVATVAENVHTLELASPRIAATVRPGQFLNIKPDDSFDPLLRRAYSVHRVKGDRLEIIFNVVGRGSAILAARQVGETLDLLGPLGLPFRFENEDYETAILVSGGVGIAPMPILGEAVQALGRRVINVHGARRASLIANDDRLIDPRFVTDDGSLGQKGNVVDALARLLDEERPSRPRLFACGPNRMLEALTAFAASRHLPLEVSLECQMACGVGICQGCPVEMRGEERRYTLVCTHGPNYDAREIVLESLPAVH